MQIKSTGNTELLRRWLVVAIATLALGMLAAPSYAQLTFGGVEVAEDEVEEQVEDQVEEVVEEETTDVAEEAVDDVVEEQVVDAAEDEIEDQLTFGGIQVEIDDQVEEQVEDAVEDDVVDDTEDAVQEEVADQAEETVEEQVADQAEETVEDQVAEDSEQSVEEQVEEATEQQIVDVTEETVEDTLTDEVEDSVLAATEEEVTSSVEADTQDQVADAVESSVEDQAEAEVEDQIAEASESDVEDAVDDSVAVAVEESVADATAEQVDAAVNDSTEDAVDDAVAVAVDESVADATSEQVDSAVDDSTENVVDDAVADAVADSAEDSIAETVVATADDAVVDQVAETTTEATESALEGALESGVSDAVEISSEGALEVALLASTEARLEAEVDEMLDTIEADIDIDEHRIHRGQWLVMAEPSVFQELADEGYLFDSYTDLPGLGLRLAEVAAPASFDISSAREGIMDVVGSDRAEVDLNHIYTAGAPETLAYESGISPRDAMVFPEDMDALAMRIGIIDSAVDAEHPSLEKANINARAFTNDTDDLPDFHGTAIASIFAGDNPELQGLAPNAELFTASVFERDADQGEIASTVSLVKALDWLLSSEVDAVNLSLAGPPNRLLEVALKRVAQQGVMVLAAAGNGGPMARPKYPAAYDTVVAVTAVDNKGRAFRLANRGDYLDLAAPGVNLRHARAGGGYAASSGTSFAVPFAATAAARLKHREPGADVLATLYASATDLGPPGRDDIYGYGMLTP